MRKIALTFAILFSLNAHSRIKVIGNGGDALVCPNEVRSFDLWEGRLNGNTYDFGSLSGGYAERARQLLARLSVKSEGQALRLSKELDYVLANLIFLGDIELDDVPDSAHALTPRNCELKQLGAFVREQPVEYINKIVVDQNLFDRMDPNHQAFFVLHEAAYRRQILDEREVDSRRARAVVQKSAGQEFLALPQTEQWRVLALLGLDEVSYAGLNGYALAGIDNYYRRRPNFYGHAAGYGSLSSINKPFFRPVDAASPFITAIESVDQEYGTGERVLFSIQPLEENPRDLILMFNNRIEIPSPTAGASPVIVQSAEITTPFVQRIDFQPSAGQWIVKKIHATQLTVTWPRDNGGPAGGPNSSLNYGSLEVLNDRNLVLDSIVGTGGTDDRSWRRPDPKFGEWSGHEFLAQVKRRLGVYSDPAPVIPLGFRDSVTGMHYQGRVMVDPWRHVLLQSFDPDAEVLANPGEVRRPDARQVLRVRRGRYFAGDERYLFGTFPNNCALLFHEDGSLVLGVPKNQCP